MRELQKKFNPTRTTTKQTAQWIRLGDFEEAKNVAEQLAFFLNAMVANKDAQQAVMENGVPWIGADIASLIAERLLDDPKINKEARRELSDLIKAGHREGSEKLELAAKKARAPANTRGKTTKTGAELFAKVLVPNKPIKRQFEERWLAAMADLNLTGTTKREYQRVADFINHLVDEKKKIEAEWKIGKRKNYEGWHPNVPKRRITRDQLEKAHLKFKDEIDTTNGITRHRIR